jgi:hydrogenase maturation protease
MAAILVLGLGNLLMADDSVGVRVAQYLAASFRFPDEVLVLDGGTLGLDLLPYLEEVDKLLVIDAVETGEAPGTLIRLSGDEIPLALATKVSPHQMGLKDLLTVADLQGYAPPVMVLWGVQPASVEMDMALTPAVADAITLLQEQVLKELAAWGVKALPR